mgnify:CR=1 FL=1
MHKYLPVLLLLILYSPVAFSQSVNPPDDVIYNPEVIATIYLNSSAEDKAFLLDPKNQQNNEYIEAVMTFVNDKLDTLVGTVGLRLRGNTSRSHPKKSFKIKFKEFGGEKFFGYKKFNLKAENNDPSFLREHMALSIYRSLDVPAARSHFVKLFYNNEYMGLYLNVEQIDDEFVDSRFGSEEGNLYKCSWGSSLRMDNNVYDNELFELETNKDINDRTILENFISLLNETGDAALQSELQKSVNVEPLMRFLAAEALLGHWDGYSFNKNNYYIYENPKTDQLEFIPYDIDNSFGINWIPLDWASRDLLNWSNENEKMPLYVRTLEVETFRTMYLSALWLMMEGAFSTEVLFPVLDRRKELLSEAVKDDPYYSKTFGYSFSDYNNSHDKEVVKHCPYGLKPYVEKRLLTASEQIPYINSLDDVTVTDGILIAPNPSYGSFIRLSSLSTDEVNQLRITSISGREVRFVIDTSQGVRIFFDDKLSPGVYIVSSQKRNARLVIL